MNDPAYTMAETVSGRDILRGDKWWATEDHNASGVAVYTSRSAAETHARAMASIAAANQIIQAANAELATVKHTRIWRGRRYAEGVRAGIRHRERKANAETRD